MGTHLQSLKSYRQACRKSTPTLTSALADSQPAASSSSFTKMQSQKPSKTFALSAPGKRDLATLNPVSIELSQGSCAKEVTLPTTMEPAENPSTATSSTM